MPRKDRQAKRDDWKRYHSHKNDHIKRVRKRDAEVEEAVRAFLLGEKLKGCTKCCQRHPAAIDFHHASGKKEASLGNVINLKWSLARVQAEVSKCVRLCASCHRIHNFEVETATGHVLRRRAFRGVRA